LIVDNLSFHPKIHDRDPGQVHQLHGGLSVGDGLGSTGDEHSVQLKWERRDREERERGEGKSEDGMVA